MLRDVAEPLDARGFEATVGVEAAGDGAVDDGLLLLLQQFDQLLLGADVAPDPPVHVVEEADDCGLFTGRRARRWHLLELFPVEAIPILDDAVRVLVDLAHVRVGPEETGEVLRVDSRKGSRDDVRRTDQPVERRDSDRSLPHAHHVVGEVSSGGPLVLAAV